MLYLKMISGVDNNSGCLELRNLKEMEVILEQKRTLLFFLPPVCVVGTKSHILYREEDGGIPVIIGFFLTSITSRYYS